ncbi:MAG: hypothetical protein B7Y77_01695, partial [Bradyrhizobium sp. 35-63-5]
AISVATVMLVQRASNDARLLAQTLSEQNMLSDLLLSMRRAESSQRGYLFTQNDAYLDEFRESEPVAKKLVDQLQDLAKGNAARLSVLDRVSDLVDTKFAEMNNTIALDKAGEHDKARAEVLDNSGRILMARIRAVIEDAIASEGKVADERSALSRQTNTMLLIVTLVGAGLIVLIGFASLVLVQRNHRHAEIARQELAGTNANLERIVEYRTADLTEANEEIQRFAYIVSHDLRSPLVNVMGFTSELEALRKDIFGHVETLTAQLADLDRQVTEAETATVRQFGEDFDEAIRFIKTSIANMDRLINAVLKLSREGRRQFHPENIDMNALLDSIGQNVGHRASEMGASIALHHLPEVESDRLALEQIFTNLVDNALKYSRPDVPLTLDVSGSATATQVTYRVKDNGRGIGPDDHQRVFELFRRSGRQDRPGEGIGLAHVRALVRRLGGTISLSSELEQGSLFEIKLPRWWSAGSRSAV